MVVLAIGIAINATIPLLERAIATQEFKEMESSFLRIESCISNLLSEGNGSSCTLELNVKQGILTFDNESDEIYFSILSYPLAEIGTRKRVGKNSFRVIGSDVSCFETHDSLVLENSKLRVRMRKFDGEVDLSSAIISVTLKEKGRTIVFKNSSIALDGNESFSKGQGYSKLSRIGEKLSHCTAVFSLRKNEEELEVHYTLFAGADFLFVTFVQRKHEKVQQSLAYHLSSEDSAFFQNLTYPLIKLVKKEFEGEHENTSTSVYKGFLSLALREVENVYEKSVNASNATLLGKCVQRIGRFLCIQCDENALQAYDDFNITKSDNIYATLLDDDCVNHIQVEFSPNLSSDARIISVVIGVEFNTTKWRSSEGEDELTRYDDLLVWNGSSWVYACDWGFNTNGKDEIWISPDLSSIVNDVSVVNSLKIKLYANTLGVESRYVRFDRIWVNVTYSLQELEFYPSGEFTSISHDSKENTSFVSLYFEASLPANTSLKFQLATNNDNQTWNFVGPDGTSESFYNRSPQAIWVGHNEDRYFKYKAYLSTQNTTRSPILRCIAFYFVNDSTEQSSSFIATTDQNVSVAILSPSEGSAKLLANYVACGLDYLISLESGENELILAFSPCNQTGIASASDELRKSKILTRDVCRSETKTTAKETINELLYVCKRCRIKNWVRLKGRSRIRILNLGDGTLEVKVLNA